MGSQSRQFRILVLVLFFGSVPFPTARAETLGFELLGGHLVVFRGSIGLLDDLRMVIDTGANETVICKKIAKKLQLEGTTEEAMAFGQKIRVKKVVLPRVKLGSLQIQDITAVVQSLSRFGDGKIDAIVGTNLLRQSTLSIDYANLRISFGSAEDLGSYITFYPGLPFVVLTFHAGEHRLRLKVDTGTGDLILYKRQVEDKIDMVPGDGVQNRRILGGGSIRLLAVSIPQLSIGKDSWQDLEALLRDSDSGLNLAGNVGPLALGLSKVVIDFQNGRFGWEL